MLSYKVAEIIEICSEDDDWDCEGCRMKRPEGVTLCEKHYEEYLEECESFDAEC